MHRDTVAIYEREAAAYDKARKPVRRDEARAFGAGVAEGGVRVDIGCGTGRYTADLGEPVVAMDAAGAMVSMALTHAPGALGVQADIERLPIRHRSLAGAWSSMTYHHIPRERLPLALAELHWAVDVGAPVDLTAVSGAYDGDYPGDDFPGRWFSGWTPEFIERVVTGAGFTVETVEPQGPNLHVAARRARSLPDTVGPGMRLLVCGLNPSLYAADAGVGYARPGNRFWPAAMMAGLVERARDPLHALTAHGIGMTDVVKRATVASRDLATDEYRAGVERLAWLVDWLRPGAVCFVGLEGWRAAVDRKALAGPVSDGFAGVPAYVMPSTSGLNARTKFDELVHHLRAAAALAVSRK
jgi:TDG/mug DNA glycosylase family protein